MEIYTLQDFLTLTKGQEYLFAIGGMILFAIFWLYLDRHPRDERRESEQNQIIRSSDTGEQK